jgi:hypothetical protein
MRANQLLVNDVQSSLLIDKLPWGWFFRQTNWGDSIFTVCEQDIAATTREARQH